MADRDPQIAGRNYPAYEQDFAAWIDAQAALLREGRFSELDIEHLVDEVESVGKSEFRSFYHALELIVFHMMKWDYQPERQGRSWRNTINEQRRHVLDLLEQNPSFKARLDEAVRRAYGPVPYMVERQTTIPAERLPETCPYNWNEIMTRLHEIDPDELWPN